MPSKLPTDALPILLKLLDEGYDKKAWHGPNLRGSVRRVEAEVAAWRPAPNRHNIWEHVLHAAYWKYAIHRRLVGNIKRGSFPLKGSNWFVRPDSGFHPEDWNTAWKADLKLLDEVHAALRNEVGKLTQQDLLIVPAGSKLNHMESIYSIAMHDVYHAGQIQLLKRLHSEQ